MKVHLSSKLDKIVLKFHPFKTSSTLYIASRPHILSSAALVVDPNINIVMSACSTCPIHLIHPSSPADIYTQALQAVILITTQQK